MNDRDYGNLIAASLVEWIGQSSCTLFVGPLISIAPEGCLGPPTPAWLAFEMAESKKWELEKYDLPYVAQLYADRVSPTDLHAWAAQRLKNIRYCPTLSHYLVAQLPFRRIVYTAQDILLRKAHDNCRVDYEFILPGGNRSLAKPRTIYELYGDAENRDSLKLTEDERRHILDDTEGLVDDMRTWARTETLLFLGYAVNDPELSDFYYHLRPQHPEKMPRAYIVGPGISPENETYWDQHNVTLYSMEPAAFLLKLAERLNLQVSTTHEDPPGLDPGELSKRDQLRARFETLSHLNGYVENGAVLRRKFDPYFVIQMNAGLGIPRSGCGPEVPTQPGGELDNNKIIALNKLKDGNIEWSQGNLVVARGCFDEALRYDPKLTDAYLSLFYLLMEKKDIESASQVYQDMVRKNPSQAFLPDKYEIRKILGYSNLGISYHVFDRDQNRILTATILRSSYSIKEEKLEQFKSQVGAISSPYISRVLGYNWYRNHTYILSEYIEGTSLKERLKGGKPIPYPEAMQIAGQIAAALEDGHRQGVWHLDLRPANILLGNEGAKLVTYGFSQLASNFQDAVKPSNEDSYDYLSPEQLVGKDIDERSDIYALGTILYEMLTGHVPGVGKLKYASEENLQVTEAVDVLIDHARERYAAKRFASASEMKAEINRISLASLKGNVNQYLRIGLSWVSRGYNWLTSRKSLIFLAALLAGLSVLSLLPAIDGTLKFFARSLLSLLLNSLLISVGIDWAIRAIARWRGLGSLITGGRGIGAILGLVFTVNLISVLGFTDISQKEEILSTFAAILAVCLVETVVALGIILLAAQAILRFFKSYTVGFYWSFVAIIGIELILTILRQPAGLISP